MEISVLVSFSCLPVIMYRAEEEERGDSDPTQNIALAGQHEMPGTSSYFTALSTNVHTCVGIPP